MSKDDERTEALFQYLKALNNFHNVCKYACTNPTIQAIRIVDADRELREAENNAVSLHGHLIEDAALDLIRTLQAALLISKAERKR